mmetsp:Transcript_20575/g.28755  ORF Transcript_20575/g.28755 Transcript_20575/m.28755 type:complete len:134 (-) Transcript_20575:218-619(-)
MKSFCIFIISITGVSVLASKSEDAEPPIVHPISREDQRLYNAYMKGIFRIGELNDLILDQRKIHQDMDSVQDYWTIAEGSWNPRIVLGKFHFHFDEELTRDIISKKCEQIQLYDHPSSARRKFDGKRTISNPC